jgi:hypothetical protein
LRTDFEVHINEMRTLRKAEKHNFTFKSEFNPERLLEMMYGMYARKQHPFRVNREKLKALISTVYQNDFLKQYNIFDGDRIVSSLFILSDKGDTCYAWLAGTEPEAMKEGAGILIFRELFQELKKDFRYLDLCGANSKGPSRLKAALGAELKPFYQIVR